MSLVNKLYFAWEQTILDVHRIINSEFSLLIHK